MEALEELRGAPLAMDQPRTGLHLRFFVFSADQSLFQPGVHWTTGKSESQRREGSLWSQR